MTKRLRSIAGLWRGEFAALAWLFGGDTVSRLVGQTALVVTARLLGPNEFGGLATALAVFALATVVCDAGTGEAAVQALTRRPHAGKGLSREVAPLRLTLALPMLPIGLLAAASSNATVRATGVLLAAIPLASFVTSRVLLGRVTENFRSAATWSSVLSLSLSLGALVAASVSRTAVVAAVGTAMLVGASGVAAARGWPWRNLTRPSLRTLQLGLPFAVTAIAVAIYSRGDRIFIAVVEDRSATGSYTAAYNVVMLAAIAGSALQAAILPRLLHEQRAGLSTNLSRRLLVLVLATLPIAVLVLVMSPAILEVVYGHGFASSSTALRILCPLITLYVINPFLASSLIAVGRQNRLAGIAALNAAISVLAYPLAISRFGIEGAAVASVLLEVHGFALQSVSLYRHRRRPVFAGSR